MNDPYDLQRFMDAQDPVYSQVCDELRRGHKTSHWMWFIFPQIEGLGHSYIAQKYALASLEETKAYLQHPVLGARLIECTCLINQITGRSIQQILGYPDDLKFRSSMTLFAQANPDIKVFNEALEKYFEGKPDSLTLARL